MALKQSVKHVGLQALAALRPEPHADLRSVRTFLLLEHAAALGTAIHATSLVPALHAAVPGARIVVLASGFGVEVFRGNPGIDAVIESPNPTKDFRGAVRVLRECVKGLGGDEFATLTPSGNERTAIALVAWRAGARDRVGFTLAPELYRAALAFDGARSQIKNNLRIVEALGHAPAAHFEPRLFFSTADVRFARALLPGRDEARPLAVLVTQTSVTQRKSWRANRFVAATRHLGERWGAEIVFVGTAGERGAVEAIRLACPGRSWNLAGQTSLPQLAALLSLCAVGVTLDTGTLHVGRAVGLPMCIIAPAWSPPVEWLPLGDPRFVILKNATMERAPEDYVIDEVSVDEVNAAVDRLMAEFGAARTAGSRKG